jgi:hypothetical protein
MAKKKKTYLQKLGLEPVRKLNKKICRERVKFLKAQIKEEAYEGKLLERAKYYANWYKWMADNGGTRSQ